MPDPRFLIYIYDSEVWDTPPFAAIEEVIHEAEEDPYDPFLRVGLYGSYRVARPRGDLGYALVLCGTRPLESMINPLLIDLRASAIEPSHAWHHTTVAIDPGGPNRLGGSNSFLELIKRDIAAHTKRDPEIVEDSAGRFYFIAPPCPVCGTGAAILAPEYRA